MSTAERLNANVSSPVQGRVIVVPIANGASVAVDLQASTFVPPGVTAKDAAALWKGRFLRITATGGTVHYASSDLALPPLALGFAGVGPVPSLPLDIGVPIADGAAPELLFPNAHRFAKFSNNSGGTVTVTISQASPPESGVGQ